MLSLRSPSHLRSLGAVQLLCTVALLLGFSGCDGSEPNGNGGGTGGQSDTGGQSNTGGSPSTGGQTSTGGQSDTGGQSNTGGSPSTGGTDASGGSGGSGGSTLADLWKNVHDAECDVCGEWFAEDFSTAAACKIDRAPQDVDVDCLLAVEASPDVDVQEALACVSAIMAEYESCIAELSCDDEELLSECMEQENLVLDCPHLDTVEDLFGCTLLR
jgi:hypothetical protein